ncbi:hypothetical protein EON80_01140 [bacterium]|nr:MAG: hypothetical protein EON80_01140 [bacterium]
MTKELFLILLANGHDELVKTFKATPDNKLNWKPFENGRSILELFSEAANTCQMTQEFVASRALEMPSYEKYQELTAASAGWSREEALAAMETNYTALVKAFEPVTDVELSTPIPSAAPDDLSEAFGVWGMMPYRTFVSRFAQINYIQTLYGDTDSH